MDARTACLWASLALTALAAGVGLTEIFRTRMRRFIAKEAKVLLVSGLVGGMWPLVPALYGPLFGPPVWRVRLGIEHTLQYRLIAGIGAFLLLSYLSAAFVTALVRLRRRSGRLRPARSLIVGVPILVAALSSIAAWQVLLGNYGALTFMTFGAVLAGTYAVLTGLLFAVNSFLHLLLKKEWGVPLAALLMGLAASLLRTVVALGLFGLGKAVD